MDMKKHMLICLSITMLMDRGKKWDSYKMEVVIRKDKKIIILKVNKKKKQLLRKKWNILFLKLCLEWPMDNHMKDSKKSPLYQFWFLITRINCILYFFACYL
jgi:hypothetical protein